MCYGLGYWNIGTPRGLARERKKERDPLHRCYYFEGHRVHINRAVPNGFFQYNGKLGLGKEKVGTEVWRESVASGLQTRKYYEKWESGKKWRLHN